MWNIDFEGKEVLIVGGTGDIGKYIALEFLSAGASVTVTGKTNKEIKNYEESKAGKKIKVKKLDITNDISINELLRTIDSLDVLINCASITKGGLEYRIENFADVVNTNLMGAMRICHELLPKIAISKGSIINITSIFSNIGLKNAPAFSATKSGVQALTRSMAACWASHDVRVNCIAPGWIKSNTTKLITNSVRVKKNIINRIPLARLGEADEIGAAAVFLASKKASYITGTTIFIDGGYSVT